MASPTGTSIDTLVPPAVAKKLGFFSLDGIINQFKDVSLHEMIRVNSSTQFLSNGTKTCYRMEYKNLTFSALAARDNYTDAIVGAHRDAYVKQPMHSISGEQQDLCFYTYSPQELVQFLEQNKNNHYTYLPITVHATESANGFRHDMLLIFDNRTKLFYWFDGRNREDYLPFGREIPKNAIDILMVQLADNTKVGYSYEPSPSWMIQGVLQPFASIGQFDFVLSTAWCYLVIQMLDGFDSPTGLLSALDTLSKEDRFHLLYNALLHMVGVYRYHKTVPQNAQVNFYDEKVGVVSQQPRPDVPQAGIQVSHAPPRLQTTPAVSGAGAIPPTIAQLPGHPLPLTPKRSTPEPTHPDLRYRGSATSSTGYTKFADAELQPMPIVSSTQAAQRQSSGSYANQQKDGCMMM